MKKILLIVLCLVTLGCSTYPAQAAPLMTNPTYRQSIYVGGGSADPVDGGIDLGANGDINTSGAYDVGSIVTDMLTVDGDAYLNGGFVIPDDVFGIWGTDLDYQFEYDAAIDAFLARDPDGYELLRLKDEGLIGSLTPSGHLHLKDNRSAFFGDDDDWELQFNGSYGLRLRDPDVNTLVRWVDEGTWATYRVGNVVIGDNTAVDAITGTLKGLLSVGASGGSGGVLVITDPSQAADNRIWGISNQSGYFNILAVTDSMSGGTPLLQATRVDENTDTITMSADTSIDFSSGVINLNGSSQVWVNSPLLDVGSSDTVNGDVVLYGDDDVTGATITMQNGASEDATIDSWRLNADGEQGDFYGEYGGWKVEAYISAAYHALLGLGLTGDQATLVLGRTDTNNGAMALLSDTDDTGGSIFLHNAPNEDADTEFWKIDSNDDFVISSDSAELFAAESDDSGTRLGGTHVKLPVKATTGDPSSPADGWMYVNTSDNKVRVYADGAWRDLATW